MINSKIKKMLPKRNQNSHKGTFGKILNVAGSKNYTGAAYLSSISALKVGAGYVTLASSEYVCQIVASLTPDLTFLPLSNTNELDEKITDFNVILIGCGLSQSESAEILVRYILNKSKELNIPTVIDADGLNILAKLQIKNIGQNFILTPHPKELSRLLNVSVDEIQDDRVKYASLASEIFDCTVILKGHNSVICNHEKLYINKSGNSSLAKAGTGDVLAGMIAGFIAQKVSGFDASMLACYIHGKIGEEYSKQNSQYSLLASEMLNFIPKILRKM